LPSQPLDSQNRITLLETIEDRHNKGSVILTAQLPVKGWYEVNGEKTIAVFINVKESFQL